MTEKNNNGKKVLIVSRHEAVIQFLKEEGIVGDVVTHVGDESVLSQYDEVYGILPVNLACKCQKLGMVIIPNLRADQRGKELSLSEMKEAGAVVRYYKVTEL